jgi:hypothetical protein
MPGLNSWKSKQLIFKRRPSCPSENVTPAAALKKAAQSNLAQGDRIIVTALYFASFHRIDVDVTPGNVSRFGKLLLGQRFPPAHDPQDTPRIPHC